MAGYYERFPLKVPVGELVRIYLMNMVEPDPIASFHLHAQTFDLYRSGTSVSAHEHTDIVSLGPAERAILELRLPRRGRYMFHPHQSRMAERGAMGQDRRHMNPTMRPTARALSTCSGRRFEPCPSAPVCGATDSRLIDQFGIFRSLRTCWSLRGVLAAGVLRVHELSGGVSGGADENVGGP